MKKNTLYSLVLILLTSILYSCNSEKGAEIEIVVSVDDNGKANGEHSFIRIADNKFQIDGIVYSVNSNGFLEVSGYDKENLKGDAHIISILEFNGKTYSVNNICSNSLAGCSEITSITIPSSVCIIGNNAFQGCSGLKDIVIGSSSNPLQCLHTIGNDAFRACSNLGSISIPRSVNEIGRSIFAGCDGLESISVQEGNDKYDSRNNCNAIIETKSNILIAGCKTTIIPNNVTKIGDNAFDGCTNLQSIKLPNSISQIGDWAFSGCNNMTSVEFSENLTCIGNNAFSYCHGLKAIVFPKGVETISEYAFLDCSGITSIDIPENISIIEGNAFQNCHNITSITVHPKNPYYDSRNNCNAIIETASNKLILGCKNTTIPNNVTGIGNNAFASTGKSISIPNSVTSIGKYAFCSCSLTSLSLPNQLSSIEDYTFYNCNELKTVTIPFGVESIGEHAFEDCTKLTTINIENGVRKIEEMAFRSCISLVSITIPSSVIEIGDGAFYNCNKLREIHCKWTHSNPPARIMTDEYGPFNDETYKQAILYVPEFTSEIYQSHFLKWSKFQNIVEE